MRTFLLLALLTLSFATRAAERELRVYHVGNSLTMSLRLDRLHRLFAERGIDYQFGSQLSGGKSLHRHWHYRNEPQQKWKCWETSNRVGDAWEPDENFYIKKQNRFGLYDEALVKHKFGLLVLQPYGSSLKEDYEACCRFIDLAREHGSAKDFVIYATWPGRPKKMVAGKRQVLPIDYAKHWQADYPYTITDDDKRAGWNACRRAFFTKLVDALNAKYPDLPRPIRLVPAGEVLYELDQAMRQGKLPGLEELARRSPSHLPGLADDQTTLADGANALYADGGHLNPIPHHAPTLGLYAAALTMFSVLAEESPVGLSAAIYDFDPEADAELSQAVQELVWSVVRQHPHTGVRP